jgi:hypothetical protein
MRWMGEACSSHEYENMNWIHFDENGVNKLIVSQLVKIFPAEVMVLVYILKLIANVALLHAISLTSVRSAHFP